MINTIKKALGIKPRYLTVKQMKELNKLSYYHIPYNKVVIGISALLVVGCIITPFTNWLIIPITKLTMRYI